jgi:transcription initiation factor TFIIIB Brf1 subunit/transcription initiation factor TFIIB
MHKRKIVNKRKIWNLFENENEEKQRKKMMLTTTTNIEDSFCEICHSIYYLSEEGFSICINKTCGMTKLFAIDYSAEWRNYGNDDNHVDLSRCGMPINPLLEESSYGCKVFYTKNMSNEMKKIKKYTDWQSNPYKEKTQFEDFQTITMIAQNAGLSKLIIDDALKYHKLVSENSSYRGINKNSILAASLYLSCGIHGFPRTTKEISEMSNINCKQVSKGYKKIQSIIDEHEKNYEPSEKTIFCKTKPNVFFDRFCCKLQMNNELLMLCKFISYKISSIKIMDNNTPHSISAGIIYYVVVQLQLPIYKKDIKTICNISDVTLNHCLKKLNQYSFIPTTLKNKYCCYPNVPILS